MLIGGQSDIRYMTIYGYARLVGYDEKLESRSPTSSNPTPSRRAASSPSNLRPGHKWSDGQPLTAEDFRYSWEDVISNEDLRRAGFSPYLLADGKPPKFEVVDDLTVRYTWDAPNPDFLPQLAAAQPLAWSCRRTISSSSTRSIRARRSSRSWSRRTRPRTGRSLHIRHGTPVSAGKSGAADARAVAQHHRAAGRAVHLRAQSLFPPGRRERPPASLYRPLCPQCQLFLHSFPPRPAPAKPICRGPLSSSTTTHSSRRPRNGIRSRCNLWERTQGSRVALLPNLNYEDPVWRKVLQDVRFRRALSLAIDRREINMAVFFGLGKASADTVLPQSPLYRQEYARSLDHA